MIIQRNIIANAVGGLWSAGLSLLIIPIQTATLGEEAFGLVVFFVSLQSLCMILDLGMGTTLIRWIAKDGSPDHQAARPVIRTLSTLYLAIGIALGAGLWLLSPLIAEHWINTGSLGVPFAVHAMHLVALTILVRWPTTLYQSMLAGLQRMDVLNLIRIVAISLRTGGGIVVLLVDRTLGHFLLWQLAAGVVEVAMFLGACLRLLPAGTLLPGFSGRVVAEVWHFALGVNLIASQAIIFSQVDRQLISTLLTLRALGAYSIACSFASAIAIVQGFITSALLPSFSADLANGAIAHVRARYAKSTQLMMVLVTLPSLLLCFFPHDLLSLFFSPATSADASHILRIFSLGYLLSAIQTMPATLCVAAGMTRFVVMVNLIALPIYIPLLYVLIRWQGSMGAVHAWILLNTGYILALVPYAQRRILERSVLHWAMRDVLPFILVGGMVFAAARTLASALHPSHRLVPLAIAGAASLVFVGVSFFLLDRSLRFWAYHRLISLRHGRWRSVLS